MSSRSGAISIRRQPTYILPIALSPSTNCHGYVRICYDTFLRLFRLSNLSIGVTCNGAVVAAGF